jgi:hypothetical protein
LLAEITNSTLRPLAASILVSACSFATVTGSLRACWQLRFTRRLTEL